MTRSDVAGRARRLADRLRRASPFLVKTELNALLGALHSDWATKVLLTSLLTREQPNLGSHAGRFAEGNPLDHQVPLEFAKSWEGRAAFGYQVLTGMLSMGEQTPKSILERVLADGQHYPDEPKTPRAKIVSFVDVFIDPIIDYLEGVRDTDDLTLATMVRYKQRCEWFDKECLRKMAWQDESPVSGQNTDADRSIHGQVEERLKRDFCRYLFDLGLEFVIEPQSPSRTGAADVLAPKLADGRRLVVEAKVYDGVRRKESWVKGGISQAAQYANDWGEPRAYLLVYNVVDNVVLNFRGAQQEDKFWVANSLNREVKIVSIDLGNMPPASQSDRISQKAIDLT